MDTAPTAHAGLRLGVEGFTYPDLSDPEGLRALHHVFDEEVRRADPDLWSRWDRHRREPAVPGTPAEVSSLLVDMASHVGRFVARLFGVEAELEAIATATRRQDPIFRFKVDFVRRRVLPALKAGGAPCSPEDDQTAARLVAAEGQPGDAELAVALAGCRLLDREAALERGAGPEAAAAVAADL